VFTVQGSAHNNVIIANQPGNCHLTGTSPSGSPYWLTVNVY